MCMLDLEQQHIIYNCCHYFVGENKVFFYLRFDAFILAVVSAPHLCTNSFLKRIWLFIHPTECIRFDVSWWWTLRLSFIVMWCRACLHALVEACCIFQSWRWTFWRGIYCFHHQFCANNGILSASWVLPEDGILYMLGDVLENILSPSSVHPDETHNTFQKSCVAIWPYYFGPG